jgi:hypothetical protein
MTKIRDHVTGGTKVPRLDRLEATLEGVVQPRQVGLAHVVIRLRQAKIDLPLRQSWRCIAGDATVLDANADCFHLGAYHAGRCLTLRHALRAQRPVRLGARHGNLPFEVFHLRRWKSFIADGRMPNANATATAPYPPPPWHTHGRAWAQPYLVDTRAFDLPPGFRPVTVACRALGILGLVEYLPPSPLTYAELVWMPCLVRAAGSRGFFVDRMYVDSEPSRAAGRAEWALPKQLARFAITDTRATIDTEDGAHLVLDLRRRGPGVPVPISSGSGGRPEWG